MCESTRLLTVAELAGALALKPRTVYEAIERGTIPVYRIGRLCRCDLAEVRAALRVEVREAER